MSQDADSFSDTSMLTDEEKEIVRRSRELHEKLHATRNQPREGGLPPEKESFPIGIAPDGTPNLVEDPDAGTAATS